MPPSHEVTTRTEVGGDVSFCDADVGNRRKAACMTKPQDRGVKRLDGSA